jgi:hypothetical protein
VVATQQDGLCMVSAVTPMIPTSAAGKELKSAFESLSDVLSEKYGKPELRDVLKDGSS